MTLGQAHEAALPGRSYGAEATMAVPDWATATMAAALADGSVAGNPPWGAGIQLICFETCALSVRFRIVCWLPVHLSKNFTE